nr:hypothetical protein K-LCC10_0419 [Kaumoebavirus]
MERRANKIPEQLFPNEILYMIGQSHWAAWGRLRQCSSWLRDLLDFDPYKAFTTKKSGWTIMATGFALDSIPYVSNVTADGMLIRKIICKQNCFVLIWYRDRVYYYYKFVTDLISYAKKTYLGELDPDIALNYCRRNKLSRESIEGREFKAAEDLCK